jgi:nucleoside triphosphate pyrophosphatase
MRVVLASRSPQRRELLERLGVQFEVVPADVEELREGEASEVVVENARRKARAVVEDAGHGAVVIGCDTEVVVDGRILGQPATPQEARSYLLTLSGREHEVLSGLVVAGEDGQERSGACSSTVTFRQLGENEVERYLESGEWRGRAGGYALQGLGSTLVARVAGDVANVIGLPIGLLLELAPELYRR